MDEYKKHIIELRDRESLQTSTLCLNIVSTLLIATGAILVLAIQQGVSESGSSRSWLVRLSIVLYLVCIVCALIALGILLIRSNRRSRTLRKEIESPHLTNNGRGVEVSHPQWEYNLLWFCVACAFVLFASATTTLGLYALCDS